MTGDRLFSEQERRWEDLPREWLMNSLEVLNANQLKAIIPQAVQWGFDEPADLTNNGKRVRWLCQCREKAWDLLLVQGDVPAPGRLCPEDEKLLRAKPVRKAPTRPARTHVGREVRFEIGGVPVRPVDSADNFPAKPSLRVRSKKSAAPVRGDLCKLPASACNDFLRTLPPPELADDGGDQ